MTMAEETYVTPTHVRLRYPQEKLNRIGVTLYFFLQTDFSMAHAVLADHRSRRDWNYVVAFCQRTPFWIGDV